MTGSIENNRIFREKLIAYEAKDKKIKCLNDDLVNNFKNYCNSIRNMN